MASTALAACFALAWAVGTRLSTPETTTIATAIPVAALVQIPADTVSLPPLHAAEIPAPTPALQSPAPAPTRLADSEPLPASATPVAPDPSAIELADAAPLPDAIPAEIQVATPAAPHPERVPVGSTTIASLIAPPIALPPARAFTKPGGVGMVLLAQRGDTLESMYRDIYRDRSAPPYAAVVAANPRPLKPGGIVVFPAPPGGWSAAPPEDDSPQR